MIPVFQKDGDRQCMRAAVASVFELPLHKVPFFGGSLKFDDAARADGRASALLETELEEWLAERGLGRMWVSEFPERMPRGICLAAGPTERITYHVVVWDSTPLPDAPYGRMIHDPHPSGTGVFKVMEWMFFIVRDASKLKGRSTP